MLFMQGAVMAHAYASLSAAETSAIVAAKTIAGSNRTQPNMDLR